MDRARRLNAENHMLKETLERMRVVSAEDIARHDMDSPSMNSQEEEYMRMRYFEMMRR